MKFLQHSAAVLERCVARAGIAVAWIGIPLLVALAAAQPVSRWTRLGDEAPWGEAATAAFLAVIMTALGYAYVEGAHVRLDHLSRRLPARANAALELAGSVLVLIPLCVLVVIDGADSAWRAFEQGERWADTGWALQWAVRLWIPSGFLLLLLAALASALRALRTLLTR